MIKTTKYTQYQLTEEDIRLAFYDYIGIQPDKDTKVDIKIADNENSYTAVIKVYES